MTTLEEKRQWFAEALGFNSWAKYEAESERVVVENVLDSPLLSGYVLRFALERAGLLDDKQVRDDHEHLDG